MRDHLDKLESKSVHILREAYAAFGNLCMLWSIGKDSTVLLWLARKAFYGHVPFPLVHIDTHYKIPEMIEYRDKLAMEYGLYMVYGENSIFRPGNTSATRTPTPTPASSSARAPMKRARAARSAISPRATSTTTGIWTTSRPSSGTSSKPTLPPARMCASTPCSTGRS